MAGESAREQALRKRAKAARLMEAADRWERGANGEVAVAAALVELEGNGWTLLHDLAWPGRKHANIDHVAIGNGHVFVIDAKNWSGEVAATGGVLRQNGRSRARQVAAIADAARAVADAVPGLVGKDVRPVLCLVRDDWFAERFGEVLVCSSHNLAAQLSAQQKPGESLAPQDVVHIVEALQTHGAVADARSDGKPRTARRRATNSRVGLAVKLSAAVATMALVLSQPAWLASAVDHGAEQFVSLITPTTSEPAPAKTPPVKERKRHRQGKQRQK